MSILNEPYGFRFMAWIEKENRLNLQGTFSAKDLRSLADWLDNPEHPCQPWPMMKVELGPISLTNNHKDDC